MHIPKHRPACWTDGEPSRRGRVEQGDPDGVRPGRRIAFFDAGRSCGQASSLLAWERNLDLTPACAGCSRAARGLAIAAGKLTPDDGQELVVPLVPRRNR